MKASAAGALALVALTAVGCRKPPAEAQPASPPRAATTSPAPWSYEVVQSGDDLEVTATFPPGTAETFSLEEGATPYVADVVVARGSPGAPLVARGGIWTAPSCARGCTIAYRFHLDEAARSLGDVDSVARTHDCIEAPPSSWLLRPTDGSADATYRFHVRPAPGSHFATGVHAVRDAPDTYSADASDLDTAPYAVFGSFRTRTLARASGASIELAVLPGKLALDDAAVDRWVGLSARAIEAYYGRFPVRRVLVILVPRRGGRGETVDGRTLAGGGSSILLGVSAGMTEDEIPRDWVLTHEMTHLALPNLPRENHWLEEGLATYVEPIARAKVGTIPDREVWRGLIEGLPNGEPEDGDEGLDRTHTWGRTYWGGALFSLVADVEIRKRTGNKKSLEDALTGIVAAGGVGEARWPIADVLREGDRVVGAPVLQELYAKWATEPVAVDLPRLWRELGVRETAGAVEYDDAAPLSALRRSIASGSEGTGGARN